MPEWNCKRCGRTFPNPVACGEHAMDCTGMGPPPAPPRPKPPGTKLEDRVKDSVKALRAEGLDLERRKPHLSMSGHVTAGKLDFEGDFRGRAVRFDAKSCAIALAISDLRKRQHQLDRVKESHERGVLAFYLVEVREVAHGPRYFALTWPVLAPFLAPDCKEKRISIKVLDAECLEIRRHGRLLDLVAVIKTLAASVAPGGAA